MSSSGSACCSLLKNMISVGVMIGIGSNGQTLRSSFFVVGEDSLGWAGDFFRLKISRVKTTKVKAKKITTIVTHACYKKVGLRFMLR